MESNSICTVRFLSTTPLRDYNSIFRQGFYSDLNSDECFKFFKNIWNIVIGIFCILIFYNYMEEKMNDKNL